MPDVQRFSNAHIPLVLRNTGLSCLVAFGMQKWYEKIIDSSDRMGILISLIETNANHENEKYIMSNSGRDSSIIIFIGSI